MGRGCWRGMPRTMRVGLGDARHCTVRNGMYWVQVLEWQLGVETGAWRLSLQVLWLLWGLSLWKKLAVDDVSPI